MGRAYIHKEDRGTDYSGDTGTIGNPERLPLEGGGYPPIPGHHDRWHDMFQYAFDMIYFSWFQSFLDS